MSRSVGHARTCREWLEHFRANEDSETLTRTGPRLSAEEREAVVDSVREFQLGENSEGKHLLRWAREYAERTGDGDYLLAVEYFIREEQQHSRYLRDFLAAEGYGTIKGSRANAVFRRLRRPAGLEVSVGVLVTAEIIAKVYYAALEEATRSPMLREICGRIRRDEEAHVRFQAQRLAILRRHRPGPGWRSPVCSTGCSSSVPASWCGETTARPSAATGSISGGTEGAAEKSSKPPYA